MKWLRLRSRKHRSESSALPADLVQAIAGVGVVFRSHIEDEYGDKAPRPLAMSFLGSRPLYLDDDDAVSKLLRCHWPELTDKQMSRALSMIGRRVVQVQTGQAESVDILKTGRRRRQGWMRFTEDLQPWEL